MRMLEQPKRSECKRPNLERDQSDEVPVLTQRAAKWTEFRIRPGCLRSSRESRELQGANQNSTIQIYSLVFLFLSDFLVDYKQCLSLVSSYVHDIKCNYKRIQSMTSYWLWYNEATRPHSSQLSKSRHCYKLGRVGQRCVHYKTMKANNAFFFKLLHQMAA